MQTKDILKELRKSKDYSSAKEFCDDFGISFNTYQNYETGKRTPTAEVLIKLADFYGVTTDYLLGRAPEQDPLNMLNLSPSEKALFQLYISFSPESRKDMEEVLRKAAAGVDLQPVIDMLRSLQPPEIQQSKMVAVETAGEFRERQKHEAEAEAEAQRKETA